MEGWKLSPRITPYREFFLQESESVNVDKPYFHGYTARFRDVEEIGIVLSIVSFALSPAFVLRCFLLLCSLFPNYCVMLYYLFSLECALLATCTCTVRASSNSTQLVNV